MAGPGKRSMPNSGNQSTKRRKGGWKQPSRRVAIESGESGVFVTCDKGRESKCVAEALDLFSQVIEQSEGHDQGKKGQGQDEDEDSDDGDIEAQIQRELAGLKPAKDKSRPFEATQLELPCVIYVRLAKSIDPVELVHDLCADAQAHPETKRCRWIKRMTPVTEVRKTLSVDLEAFAKEILKPHFHSGGPPTKYAIRPTVRGNEKFNRDAIIKTVADIVGPEHPVDLRNYDKIILIDVVQNVIGMSVVGGDYEKLKRYNIAEIYNPSLGPTPPKKAAAPAPGPQS